MNLKSFISLIVVAGAASATYASVQALFLSRTIADRERSDYYLEQTNQSLSNDDSTVDSVIDASAQLSAIQIESNSRPWQAPNYLKQNEKLGYANAFSVPKALETRVNFWKRIYTEFNSNQGLIHDARYIHIVYDSIDFSGIMRDTLLSPAQKSKARRSLLKEKKDKIAAKLLYFNTLSNPSSLSQEDLKIWNAFQLVKEENKFVAAAEEGRIRFQLGQSDYVVKGIYNSGRYLETMEKIFDEHNLPRELTRLPFVESSFNLNARSKVGASGIWQFMRSTGKQYMKVGSLIDERNDPIIATKAAAKKLANNYRLLGNWPLALTAYNYGPSGLMRMSKKYNTDDLSYLIENAQGDRFGFASKNFYASFLAIVQVEQEANKYFSNLKWAPKTEFKEHFIAKNILYSQLVDLFQSEEEFIFYNPHFTKQGRRSYSTINKGSNIRFPLHSADRAIASLDAMEMKKNTQLAKNNIDTYQVTKGDTLIEIARSKGVSLKSLMQANEIEASHRLQVGQNLIIPKN